METYDNSETGDKPKTDDITKTIGSVPFNRITIQNKKKIIIYKHPDHWSTLQWTFTFRSIALTEERRTNGPIVVDELDGK